MGQTQGIWSLHLQQADHLREAMPLKIGISCAIISISRWIPALKRSPLWVKTLKRKECGKGIRQRKDGLYSARCYTKDGERRENTASRCPKPSKRTPQPPAICSAVGNRAAHGWLIGLIGAAIHWEKRTLTVQKWGGNPKIGQDKITIIKENFGIWN